MKRLIDADALKAKLQKHHDIFVNAYDGFRDMPFEERARVDEITKCIAEVDNAPTVEERPRGKWIPVSERLPKDMQRVLVWFEYYRYGVFNCMYQTYGFGYVCDGKWSPSINGETGWQDSRIIAWQELPEPYK